MWNEKESGHWCISNKSHPVRLIKICSDTKGRRGWQVMGHPTENIDLRLWVQSPAAHANNFSTPCCKKINNVSSVRVIVICSDHKLLWQDSYKGVDRALTPNESILHKIIIIDHLTKNQDLRLLGNSLVERS